jgi:hypothetical protein
MLLSSCPITNKARAEADGGLRLSDFDLRACLGVDDLRASVTVMGGPGDEDEGPASGTRRFGHACSIVLGLKLSDNHLWNIRAALILKAEDMHRTTGVRLRRSGM